MKLLDARSKVGYDTEDFEAKAAEAIMGLRDERIVKPRQFKISETDPRGIMNGISVYSDEEMDRVEACNARILWGTPKYTEGEKAGYDAVFKCVVPSQLELAHQSKVFGLRGINFLEEFIQNKVVGDPNF